MFQNTDHHLSSVGAATLERLLNDPVRDSMEKEEEKKTSHWFSPRLVSLVATSPSNHKTSLTSSVPREIVQDNLRILSFHDRSLSNKIEGQRCLTGTKDFHVIAVTETFYRHRS